MLLIPVLTVTMGIKGLKTPIAEVLKTSLQSESQKTPPTKSSSSPSHGTSHHGIGEKKEEEQLKYGDVNLSDVQVMSFDQLPFYPARHEPRKERGFNGK